MLYYNYIGLNVKSNIELPFREIAPTKEVQVSVTWHDATQYYDGAVHPVTKCGSRYFLNIKDAGCFVISHDTIECFIKSKTAVLSTICNIPFAIIALMHGIIPLHSSAIFDPYADRVHLLCGRKGAGKSTLAFSLMNVTCARFFGDDVIGLQNKLENPIAFVGSNRIKLCADVYDKYVHFQKKERVVYNEFNNKYIIRITGNGIVPAECNVGKIVMIAQGQDFDLTNASSFLSQVCILQNLVGINFYTTDLVDKARWLIRNIPIIETLKLSMPNDLKDLDLYSKKFFNLL